MIKMKGGVSICNQLKENYFCYTNHDLHMCRANTDPLFG